MAWRKTARRFPPWRGTLMNKGSRCELVEIEEMFAEGNMSETRV